MRTCWHEGHQRLATILALGLQNCLLRNIKDFEHGGATMSGLASEIDIRAGKEVLGFPEHTRVTDAQLQDERFLGCDGLEESLKMGCGYAKHAMWLAEKKLQVLGSDADDAKGWLPSWIRHRLVETGDAEKDYWAAWIHSLPKYEDYQQLGLPLTASPAELVKLRGLPKFGSVPAWTEDLQGALRKELDFYNARRGNRPEITWKDALWGLMAAFPRTFDCGGQGHMTMAPVGDMVNHSSTPNLVYHCERDMLKFTTRRAVRAGDELLVAYHPPKDGSAMLLSQYGILDTESDKGSWSEDDCRVLHDAHLEQSESTYLKNAAKLIDANCPAMRAKADVLQANVQVPWIPLHAPREWRRSRWQGFL
ncbi:unnamed protein product [Durusdinium trenchii]|uniref:SET domain-containing protein n=1 Tax=Durusdinium trenchii TaxID=1381693 RepID=A0ABP0MLU7_9DINO